MSDTGSNDPYDPNRPPPPPEQSPPPQDPQWGAPPPGQPPASGQQPGYGQPPAYGSQPFGQPAYGQSSYGQPSTQPPPNYLVWAILSTLFCCLPLGIASIVFAAQVNSKHAAGDYAGAQESSRKAKQFATWSAIAGVVVIAIYVILVVLVAGAGST